MAPRNAGASEFWAKVTKTLGCWLWTGKISAYGYGLVRRRGISNDMIKAHRYAWTISYGEIPEGQSVLHRCDVPRCVNPEHLFLGTQSDNAKDMWAKGRARPTPSLGSKHGNSKLTEDQVLCIRRAYASGQTLTAISKTYNVTPGLIGHIVHRIAWKHV